MGHRQDFVYSTHKIAMSTKNIVSQNMIHYCTCTPTFSYVMHMVHWCKSVVHSWHPSAMNGPVAKVNKFFFLELLSMSYTTRCLVSWYRKVKFISSNVCFVSLQITFRCFLSIILYWFIEGNLSLCVLHKASWLTVMNLPFHR